MKYEYMVKPEKNNLTTTLPNEDTLTSEEYISIQLTNN